ncbi:MAG: nicotinate-nucleotide--dimethylbenzimidazole phosphoribosyltransferase [Desulfovibrio sp.]|nr:nicotinate-nucleotide--dimethylbenzimidazole phosphoribosyltransferase [Desulfovibrio sp.]
MSQNHSLLNLIQPDLEIWELKEELLAQGQAHLDSLTKPLGSLGRLEEIARRLYAIHQGKKPLLVSPAILYTVAADHGVAEQKVSAYPQSVTRQMVANFLAGGGAINVLCRENGLTFCLVDAGCKGGAFPEHPLLLERRLGDGTKDLSKTAAMSVAEALQGLVYGVELAKDAALEGCQCLAIGEMGIANTTAATALFCVYLNLNPKEITGQGSGLSREGLEHKVEVISQALNLHTEIVKGGQPLEILAALGGFEIAVMAGLMLGAASEHLPFLVDGFISLSAYVVAKALEPKVSAYAFLSHSSAEQGTALILHRLGERPLLELGLRLGEGTGAALAYPLLRSAAAIFNQMATFSSAGIAGARS